MKVVLVLEVLRSDASWDGVCLPTLSRWGPALEPDNFQTDIEWPFEELPSYGDRMVLPQLTGTGERRPAVTVSRRTFDAETMAVTITGHVS